MASKNCRACLDGMVTLDYLCQDCEILSETLAHRKILILKSSKPRSIRQLTIAAIRKHLKLTKIDLVKRRHKYAQRKWANRIAKENYYLKEFVK